MADTSALIADGKVEDAPAGASGVRNLFRICAQSIAQMVGSPWTFAIALFLVVCWAVTGPVFHYSNTWQLVINTATTIVTFLMVFLIQNTQNRDTKAIHLKLDELLRGVHGARTSLMNLENLTDEQLDDLQREFERLRARAQKRLKQNGTKTLPEKAASH